MATLHATYRWDHDLWGVYLSRITETYESFDIPADLPEIWETRLRELKSWLDHFAEDVNMMFDDVSTMTPPGEDWSYQFELTRDLFYEGEGRDRLLKRCRASIYRSVYVDSREASGD